MGDLLMDYFKRDLNDRELEQLEALLQGPEENAQRFANNAAVFYKSLGLPEGASKLPWFGGAGLGVVLGLAGWMLWKSLAPQPVPVAIAPVAVSPAPLPAKAAVVMPRKVHPQAAAPAAAVDFDLLSVQLELEEQRLVTVRVLDSRGVELRNLFAGVMEAGHWKFDWDGQVQGAPVAPGEYVIEVRSGDLLQKKPVQIGVAR
jgi:hypothetical protein